MPDRVRFVWLLQVCKVAIVLGWALLWLVDAGQPAGDKVLGLLAVAGLVLVLGAWFIRLTPDPDPDDNIVTMVVWDPGGPGRESDIRPYRRSYFSLLPPWFLLPLILVFGCLGVAMESVLLFLVPVAVAAGWVILIVAYAVWWLSTYE
jgi:hypothetical protein